MQFKKGDSIEVTIDSLAFEGDSIGRFEDLVVFTDSAAPGDQVEVLLTKIKKNFLAGHVRAFKKLSSERITPKCPHFGLNTDPSGKVFFDPLIAKNCGGCTWQFLSYQKQLQTKQQIIVDALQRIGGFDAKGVEKVLRPIIGMENPWFYRNKMEFSFHFNRNRGIWQLGLHKRGRFYDICEIGECSIFRDWVGEYLKLVRGLLTGQSKETGAGLSESALPETALPETAGLQNLTIRQGQNSGEILINLQTENGPILEGWFELTKEYFEGGKFGNLVSITHTEVINQKGQSKKWNEKVLLGQNFFTEKYLLKEKELHFRVSTTSFLQPNTKQAELFYQLIIDLVKQKDYRVIFDLFCGTGTIGICLSDGSNKVIGVELNQAAIEKARENAKINGIEGVEFFCGDVEKVLTNDLQLAPDLIVFDPPRAGLSAKTIEFAAGLKAKEIIYVSCNPSTLARDLAIFAGLGWSVDFLQPIDQFPHTYHLECVASLKRAES